MTVRAIMLQKIHNAGCGETVALPTVHQRPPKKKAPSSKPERRDRDKYRIRIRDREFGSVIGGVRLIVVHGLVFRRNPMPSIQAP